MGSLTLLVGGGWIYFHYQRARTLIFPVPASASNGASSFDSNHKMIQSFESMELLRGFALQLNLPAYATFAESSLGAAYGARGAKLAPGLEQSAAMAASRYYFDLALKRSLELAAAGNPLPLFYTAQLYVTHLYSTGEILRATEVSMRALSYQDKLKGNDSSLAQTLLELTEKLKK